MTHGTGWNIPFRIVLVRCGGWSIPNYFGILSKQMEVRAGHVVCHVLAAPEEHRYVALEGGMERQARPVHGSKDEWRDGRGQCMGLAWDIGQKVL